MQVNAERKNSGETQQTAGNKELNCECDRAEAKSWRHHIDLLLFFLTLLFVAGLRIPLTPPHTYVCGHTELHGTTARPRGIGELLLAAQATYPHIPAVSTT